ncbi:MAG: hypothetical protein HY674_06330 [Chloroflexi bacterium]|nr:hypothetical protein [Chloroflexota bacterium]
MVEPVFNDNGRRTPGISWVPGLDHVALAPSTEKEWNQWPAYAWENSSKTNAALVLGQPERVTGTVVEPGPARRGCYPGQPVQVVGSVVHQDPGQTLRLSQGTNQILVHSQDAVLLASGSTAKAAGFFGREGGKPVLYSATISAVTEQKASPNWPSAWPPSRPRP